MALKDVLPIDSVQEANALVSRPSWCPLPDHCLPVGRTPDEENLDLCFGVSRGKVIHNGDNDFVYSRICAEPNTGEEEAVPILALDGTASAIFLSLFAQAHAEQLTFLFKMYGDSDEDDDGGDEEIA